MIQKPSVTSGTLLKSSSVWVGTWELRSATSFMGILPMAMRGSKDSSHEHGQASEQKARTGRERIHGPGLGDDRRDASHEQMPSARNSSSRKSPRSSRKAVMTS